MCEPQLFVWLLRYFAMLLFGVTCSHMACGALRGSVRDVTTTACLAKLYINRALRLQDRPGDRPEKHASSLPELYTQFYDVGGISVGTLSQSLVESGNMIEMALYFHFLARLYRALQESRCFLISRAL